MGAVDLAVDLRAPHHWPAQELGEVRNPVLANAGFSRHATLRPLNGLPAVFEGI